MRRFGDRDVVLAHSARRRSRLGMLVFATVTWAGP
jgi:hypothetical protein